MTPNAEIFISEISYFRALYLSKFFSPGMLPFIEVLIGSFLLLDSSLADTLLKGNSLELEIIKHYSCHLAIVKYEL